MKNMSAYVKRALLPEELEDSVPPVNNMIDSLGVEIPDAEQQVEELDFDPVHDVEKKNPWDSIPKAYDLHPDSFGGEDFPPLVTPEEASVIQNFYKANPQLKADPDGVDASYEKATPFSGGTYRYNPDDAWIQTYSGRRFTPTNPNPDAIVIQDIAHSLSMQCRFSGHVKKFYSVAQHSVLVSYICNDEDALWGLMHDATEAYLVDVPRPLKRSGKFDAYLDFEYKMQLAVCKRFGLPEKEPPSVKKADTLLLATEARDLMSPLRTDWIQPVEPLPFKIDPLGPRESKDLFMKRFFELTKMPGAYEHYLHYENLK
jgi:5'-deoxynucleotidase YfbR-like HD superfamily hydrolase